MIELIAQTYPAWRTWTPSDWGIIGTVIVGIINVIGYWHARAIQARQEKVIGALARDNIQTTTAPIAADREVLNKAAIAPDPAQK
jgi:hypothetical protein